MIDSLTFCLTREDGTTTTEMVPLDFSDIPGEVIARIVAESDMSDPADVTAAVLAWRLSVPKEIARTLVDELNRGEGVTASG